MTRDDRPVVSGPLILLENVVVWAVIAVPVTFAVWAFWQAMHA